MKQKFLLCAVGLTALLLSGCSQAGSQMSYIGAETAKRTALEAASLTAEEVSSITTDMSTRDGLDYYQVCFEAGGQSYRYDVDALTGMVIDAQGPAADAAQAGQPEAFIPDEPEASDPDQSESPGLQEAAGQPSAVSQQPAVSQPSTVSQQPTVSQSAASPPPSTSAPGTSSYIGESEALRIALAHAGLDAAQTTSSRSKLDFEDGRWIYEVEFSVGAHEEHDYEIDAYTGAVISFDHDMGHRSPEPDGSSSSSGTGSSTITPEQAKQLALAQVPGASESNIRKFKTDYDDGVLQYEGEIVYNGMEYEFEIDAYSGLIREWSAEPAGH